MPRRRPPSPIAPSPAAEAPIAPSPIAEAPAVATVAPAEAPVAEPPSPFAARHARALVAVQQLLDRFVAHRFGVQYAPERPSIVEMARELFVRALAIEHTVCPSCGADCGVRVSTAEANTRALEIEQKLLHQEYQERCITRDVAALRGPAAAPAGVVPAGVKTGGSPGVAATLAAQARPSRQLPGLHPPLAPAALPCRMRRRA